MTKTWIISDTHFFHHNILKFTDAQGKRFRGDLFKDMSDMNETMIRNWNSVVGPDDIVWHLGDVFFGDPHDAANILVRLNGHKNLILGNHDDPKCNVLQKFFKKIKLIHSFRDLGVVMTHMPLHAQQMTEKGWIKINLHGHIHQNNSPPGPYKNMSVEKIDYTPVLLEKLV